jgi:hypothetical protein
MLMKAPAAGEARHRQPDGPHLCADRLRHAHRRAYGLAVQDNGAGSAMAAVVYSSCRTIQVSRKNRMSTIGKHLCDIGRALTLS